MRADRLMNEDIFPVCSPSLLRGPHPLRAPADLAAGRLVRPFDISLPAQFAYYVVCPEAAAGRPKIVAFREWLMAEAGMPPGGGVGGAS